jgi:hypothetical protein
LKLLKSFQPRFFYFNRRNFAACIFEIDEAFTKMRETAARPKMNFPHFSSFRLAPGALPLRIPHS